MRKRHVVFLLSLCALLIAPGFLKVGLAETAGRAPANAIGVGVRYNQSLSSIKDTDFEEDYLSYNLGAKFELNNLWKLEAVVEYYPEQENVSYVLSPRLGLLYGRSFYAGLGITQSYIELESGDSDWADHTYFFQMGLELPFAGTNALNIDAFYKLDELSDTPDMVTDFDSDFLTFGIAIYHYF